MQFFLIDVGTAAAALLGYLALVALRRQRTPALASRRPAISRTEAWRQ